MALKCWYWIIVATWEVARQATHTGIFRFWEEATARQFRQGDWVIFYSAVTDSRTREKCQMFTAIGSVEDPKPDSVITKEGYVWFPRKFRFLPCQPASIRPLIPKLSFIRDPQHWGMPFKSGQFEISREDFRIIAHSLGIVWDKLELAMNDCPQREGGAKKDEG